MLLLMKTQECVVLGTNNHKKKSTFSYIFCGCMIFHTNFLTNFVECVKNCLLFYTFRFFKAERVKKIRAALFFLIFNSL